MSHASNLYLGHGALTFGFNPGHDPILFWLHLGDVTISYFLSLMKSGGMITGKR